MEIKRCYGCMNTKSDSQICEHCGYDDSRKNEIHQLQTGTVLKEQYMIGRVLGQGGFGITYLGWDMLLDVPVAIKEYFPSGTVMRETSVSLDVVSYGGDVGVRFRNNKERFMREAKMLARFAQEPEIVQIKNFFQANNTAYIVMEYVNGITLKQYVKRQGGCLSVDHTFELMKPVITALGKVHKSGLVHRDISPDNIMMLPEGRIKLLDFGAVRDVGDADVDKPLTKSTEAILKQGYAPIEQYQNRGSLGPWTDVYSLCATIYYCLAGEVPPDAPERLLGEQELELKKRVPDLSDEQEQVLNKGMELIPKGRIRSMEELYCSFYGSKDVQSAPIGITPLKDIQLDMVSELDTDEAKTEPLRREELKTEPLRREDPKTEPLAKEDPKTEPLVKEDPKTEPVGKTEKSGGGKKLIMILILAVVIIGGVGLAGTLFGNKGKTESGEVPVEAESPVEEQKISEVIAEGEGEEGLTWTFDSEGVLVLSGNGKVSKETAWSEYNEKIKNMVIEADVQSVDAKIFADCKNLESVVVEGYTEITLSEESYDFEEDVVLYVQQESPANTFAIDNEFYFTYLQ